MEKEELIKIVSYGLTGDSSTMYDVLRDILGKVLSEEEYNNMTYEEIYNKYKNK